MMIDEDIRMYLRLHPKWYLILSRYPQEFPTLLEEYRVENKLTMADRIEKDRNNVTDVRSFYYR